MGSSCAGLNDTTVLPAQTERMQRATVQEVAAIACPASQHHAFRHPEYAPFRSSSCAQARIFLSFSRLNETLGTNFSYLCNENFLNDTEQFS